MDFTIRRVQRTLACLLVLAAAASATHSQSCVGCLGSGGAAVATSGSATVSISVTVEAGKCKLVSSAGDPPQSQCAVLSACIRTVERSWSGLAPNSEMAFCYLQANGEWHCRTPAPGSGATGSGSSPTVSDLLCGISSAASISAGTLVATAAAICSACPE